MTHSDRRGTCHPRCLTLAEVFRGDVNDLDRLRTDAQTAHGVIHVAFNHDFSNLKQTSEDDRKVIETLGDVLTGSDRPLVITSGTGLARSKTGSPAVETDDHLTSAELARAASEEAADALIAKGGRIMVMRLPQVHDTRHQGRIAQHILLARKGGRAAYVGEGKNRLPAVHFSDAVRLYRLALEEGRAGARYHAVGEEGVALRDIAEVIGAGLKIPVESITPEEAFPTGHSNLADPRGDGEVTDGGGFRSSRDSVVSYCHADYAGIAR